MRPALARGARSRHAFTIPRQTLSTLIQPMQHSSTFTALCAAFTLALGAGVAAAQTATAGAGSESFIMVQPEASSGTEVSMNASFRAEWSLTTGFNADTSSSESFGLTSGAIFDDGTLTGGTPMVFGVSEQVGAAAGGESATVFGFGFAEPGAGTTDVVVGALPASNVQVQSNTSITLQTPAGVNAYANPLGLGPVAVTNAHGSHAAAEGYAFLPALIEQGPTSFAVGEARFWIVAEPGSICLLAYGQSVPGVAVPIAPYQGALELTVALKLLGGFSVASDGIGRFVRPLPPNPALAGLTIKFQALTVGSPGSFSNVTPVLLQP